MRMTLILFACLAFIVHLEHVLAYLLGFWIDFTRKILSKLKSGIRGSKNNNNNKTITATTTSIVTTKFEEFVYS